MKAFTIKTKQKSYRKYNNQLCIVVSSNRTDGLIEVYVPKYEVFILLTPHELEDL
nr:MAG TPA: hypothetical protein [Caudoviricetes sp.]